MLASVFQLASMAARSMVRTPPASVGSEASGGTSTGRRSGSWTVITRGLWRGAARPSSAGGQSYERPLARAWQQRQARLAATTPPQARVFKCAVARPARGRLDPFRHLIVAREIIEAGDRRVELDVDGAGWAVALLADDDLGLAVHAGHFHLPLRILVGARPRLLVAQVIFLAEHKEHDVGVLLDRARLAQVGELRPFVIAVLDLARELRERQDRHVELLGERLEARGDLGHFLHTALHGAPGRALQQLDVIDHEEVETLLSLKAPGAGGKLRDGQSASLVDEERQVLQLDRHVLDLLEVPFVDAAAPDGARGNVALLGDDARGKLLRRHFEREEAGDAAVHGVDMAVGAHFAAPGARDVVGNVGGERGLAHAGAAGDDDQVGRLQAAHLAVEVLEAGCQPRELSLAL